MGKNIYGKSDENCLIVSSLKFVLQILFLCEIVWCQSEIMWFTYMNWKFIVFSGVTCDLLFVILGWRCKRWLLERLNRYFCKMFTSATKSIFHHRLPHLLQNPLWLPHPLRLLPRAPPLILNVLNYSKFNNF